MFIAYDNRNGVAPTDERGVLRADRDGIIVFDYVGLLFWKLTRGTSLYTIYENEDYLLREKFPTRLKVEIDEYSKEQKVCVERVAGSFDGIDLGAIFLSLICLGGNHKMRIKFRRKNFSFGRKQSLQMLFSDGEIWALCNHTRPVKDDRDSSLSVSEVDITLADLNRFVCKDFLKWRIVNEENLVVAEGRNRCCSVESSELTQILSEKAIKSFVKEYIELVKGVVKNSAECSGPLELNQSLMGGCSVYLMLDEINGFYKIGISNNPSYRERTLQSEKPTIRLVCSKEYPTRLIAESIESALHKAYAGKRIRGEWFILSLEDAVAIEKTLS